MVKKFPLAVHYSNFLNHVSEHLAERTLLKLFLALFHYGHYGSVYISVFAQVTISCPRLQLKCIPALPAQLPAQPCSEPVWCWN